ncbi:MAG: hypothetical protein GF404_09205 [candidate division Zixibacteria bacterium]|nr:hypothetical protein [candidate division Zixibacteria bacterium]
MRVLLVICLACVMAFCGCQDKPLDNQADMFHKIDTDPGINEIASQIDYYQQLENSKLNDFCHRGTLQGYWIRDAVFSFTGELSGVMYEKNNAPFAYYNGEFFKTNDGNQYFSASISGYYTDHVMGFMFGTWYYDDYRMCPMCGTGHGQFNGYLVLYENSEWGKVRGEFGDYTQPVDQDSLPMSGVWKTVCRNTDSVEK